MQRGNPSDCVGPIHLFTIVGGVLFELGAAWYGHFFRDEDVASPVPGTRLTPPFAPGRER
jgi:hypothetical protein